MDLYINNFRWSETDIHRTLVKGLIGLQARLHLGYIVSCCPVGSVVCGSEKKVTIYLTSGIELRFIMRVSFLNCPYVDYFFSEDSEKEIVF